MADGVPLNPGTGGKVIDSVELNNGRQVEHVQLATVSEDGIATPISPDNPLPIQIVGGLPTAPTPAMGIVGKTAIEIGDANYELTPEEASKGVIAVMGWSMTAPRELRFPEVVDVDGVYT